MSVVDPFEASLPAGGPATPSSPPVPAPRDTKSVLTGKSGRFDAMKRALACSAAPWLIVGLALVLSSPSLFTGFVADDYIHELMMREHPGIAGYAFRPF